jgi:hypothetical protein
MTLALNETADRIAPKIRDAYFPAASPSQEEIRDLCEIATGGELDAKPLDLLTDLVWSRLLNLALAAVDQAPAGYGEATYLREVPGMTVERAVAWIVDERAAEREVAQ